jgi:hypothetical protein
MKAKSIKESEIIFADNKNEARNEGMPEDALLRAAATAAAVGMQRQF